MKSKAILTVSIAFAFSAALYPGFARSQAAQETQSASTENPAALAAQMVPAQAVLVNELDARKMQPGQQFKATLSDKVHLKNGTELPKGTVLLGTISADNAHAGGQATLALRFTQADVKGGQAIPIQATVVGVAPPSDEFNSDYSHDEPPPAWDGVAVKVDQQDALSGVDMHSTINGNNSAVFISTKKDDVKLDAQTQLALAIGTEGARQMRTGGL